MKKTTNKVRLILPKEGKGTWKETEELINEML